MQTLWNRVAQVRSSCRCSLCHPLSGSGVRRPSSFAPGRRRPTQGEIFLVFSSTIALEATLLDSVRKKKKFQKWDEMIAEEHEHIAQVDQDHKTRIDRLLANAEKRAKERFSGKTSQETDERQGHEEPTTKPSSLRASLKQERIRHRVDEARPSSITMNTASVGTGVARRGTHERHTAKEDRNIFSNKSISKSNPAIAKTKKRPLDKRRIREYQLESALVSDEIFQRTEPNHSMKVSENLHVQPKRLFLRWDWPGVFEWAARCSNIRQASGFQEWKGMPLQWLVTLSKNQIRNLAGSGNLRSWYYGGPSCADLDPDPFREAPSPQKLARLEWSIVKLVLRLLNRYQDLRYRTGRDLTISTSINFQRVQLLFGIEVGDLDQIETAAILDLANANLARRKFTNDADTVGSLKRPKCPRFTWQDGQSEEDRVQLITDLYYAIQDLTHDDNKWSGLFRCCELIMSARVAPNIHVYNMLLVRLCQLEDWDLAEMVVTSMQEVNVRPNEITHATLLRYYTLTNQRNQFGRYLDQMYGLKGGLSIFVPNNFLHPAIQHQARRFDNDSKKVAVLARKNQEVWTALIVGILHFFKPKDAMFWYRNMVSEGWQASQELLVAMLRSCCSYRDWLGGVAVWKEFGYEDIPRTAAAYHWMMRLCQSCGQEESLAGLRSDAKLMGFVNLEAEDASRQGDAKVPAEAQRPSADRVLLQESASHSIDKEFEDLTSAVVDSEPIPLSSLVPGSTQQRQSHESELPPLSALSLPSHSNRPSTRTASSDLVILDQKSSFINTLSRHYAALKRARAYLSIQLAYLSFTISETTEEIIDHLPLAEKAKFRYRVSVLFDEDNANPQVRTVAYSNKLYEEFSQHADHAMEKLYLQKQREEQEKRRDTQEKQDQQREAQVEALAPTKRPQMDRGWESWQRREQPSRPQTSAPSHSERNSVSGDDSVVDLSDFLVEDDRRTQRPGFTDGWARRKRDPQNGNQTHCSWDPGPTWRSAAAVVPKRVDCDVP